MMDGSRTRRSGLLALLGLAASCLSRPAAATDIIIPEIVSSRPHDTMAFTEGLLLYDGSLYESTGNYGESTLRQVEPWTGTVQHKVELANAYFGEGLARIDTHLVQLTWKEQVAFIYDAAGLQKIGELTYSGEGWGLCYDGEHLVMSNGSDVLQLRDPQTFALVGTVNVTLDGLPLMRLNELECVGGAVFANIWTSDAIVRIDPSTGVVTAQVSCGGLLTPAEALHADVLNGIAFNPATSTFLITGKLWPRIFEARFGDLVPPPDGGPSVDAGPSSVDPSATRSLNSGGASSPSPSSRRSASCAASPVEVPVAVLGLIWALSRIRRRGRPTP